MRLHVIIASFIFGLGFSLALAQETEKPAWVAGVEAVESAALNHLAVIDTAMAEREAGQISEETLAELARAHNALADALQYSSAEILGKADELETSAIECMGEEGNYAECEKKLKKLSVFFSWAKDALAANAMVSLGLWISETLLKEEEA